MSTSRSSVFHARIGLIVAAVLWSLGGLFTRLLQVPTVLGLNDPELSAIQIAFYRALFAGLVLLPFVRRSDLRFQRLMIGMVASFAAMNALFVSAMAYGPAANAILLQNAAPFLVYFVSVNLLGETPDPRGMRAMIGGMIGILIVILGGGNLQGAGLGVTALGIGSAVCYGIVILCLRQLQSSSPKFLIMLNHLGSAFCIGGAMLIVLGPTAWGQWITAPSPRQIAFLAAFGAVQMGIPYLLFASGLRAVSTAEAAAITLIEPLLNPIWAFLIAPETDTPPWTTILGGAFVLGALAYRYWPRNDAAVSTGDADEVETAVRGTDREEPSTGDGSSVPPAPSVTESPRPSGPDVANR